MVRADPHDTASRRHGTSSLRDNNRTTAPLTTPRRALPIGECERAKGDANAPARRA